MSDERNITVTLTEREARILQILTAHLSPDVFGYEMDRPLFKALGMPRDYTLVPNLSEGSQESLDNVLADEAFADLILRE